jgi:hypothetical protein
MSFQRTVGVSVRETFGTAFIAAVFATIHFTID